jgi:hypothetical protein
MNKLCTPLSVRVLVCADDCFGGGKEVVEGCWVQGVNRAIGEECRLHVQIEERIVFVLRARG